jgi:hypothetical protein
MRNEGVSSRGREVVCVPLVLDTKYNATLIGMNGCVNLNDPNLDAPSQQTLRNNQQKFEELARCVGRMHTRSATGGSGVTFAVAPGK